MKVVLVIDDEPQMGPLVDMVLGDRGVRVLAATTFEEALAEARRAPPDVVLLDLALGNEDGLALLPRLREDPSLKDAPIIAFTVHDSKRQEAMSRGATGFVAKPFLSSELLEALAPHLDAQ